MAAVRPVPKLFVVRELGMIKRSGASVGACGTAAPGAAARWKIVGCGRIAGKDGTGSAEEVGKLLLRVALELELEAGAEPLLLLGDKPWWIKERMSMRVCSGVPILITLPV